MWLAIAMGIVLLQGPRLTAADAGAIARVAAATLVPDTGSLDRRPIHRRRIVVDLGKTRAAFGPAGSALTAAAILPGRPATAMPHAAAVACDSAGVRCPVAGDGIYFAIDSVDRMGARPGELRVLVSLRWTHARAAGRTEVQGTDVGIYVALTDRRWRFVRYGSATTG